MPPAQFDETKHHVLEAIQRAFSNTKITMIAELHKSTDVHYHGILSCDLPISRQTIPYKFMNIWRNSKLIGTRNECEQINDYDKVASYITQDIPETSKLLGVNPVVIDQYRLTVTTNCKEP